MLVSLMNINYSIFQEINAVAGTYSWLDMLMIFCANSLIFLFPLLLLLLWGRPLWWRKQPLSTTEETILQERRSTALWVGIACIVAYAFNLLIEQFVFEPRPFVTHHVHLLVSHAADSSFPSDHTAWAFAVVGMLLFQFFPLFSARQKGQQENNHPFLIPFLAWVLALLFAVSIGIARIFVGVHYPDDILGGAIDGLFAAVIVTLLRIWLRRPTIAVIRFAHTLRLA